MALVRNVLLSFVSSSALYSGLSSALGLGEITLYSALNQPLDAKIELLEVGDLSADEVLARLASPEVFARSGVERFYFLNDLRFTPVLQGAGSFIRVVSSKRIREPYLNFVVELERPAGRLLREYTLLLDPPGTSSYQTAGQPPVPAVPEATPERPTSTARPPASAVPPPALRGRRHAVVRGDSLWAIAEGLQANGSQASVSELMQGIHALNPQAFVNNDSGRLKLGANLLLPDAAEAGVTTGMSAEDPVPEAQAESALVQQAGSAAEPTDMLVLEEPAESNASRLADLQRQADQLLAARAEESKQLQQAIGDLQQQVQQLQVQMDSKDALLAQLQATPAAPQASAPAAPAEPAAVRVEQSSWLNGTWLGGLLVGTLVLIALQFGVLLALLPRLRRNRLGAAEDVPAPIEPAPQVAAPRDEPVVRVPLSEAVPARGPLVSTDALEGANIYIAYGRFSEAVGVLSAALDKQPERTDLRFRLLEVLAELGDPAGFVREQAILRESGFSELRLEQLQARYPRLATAAPLVQDEVVAALEESRQLPASNELLDDFQLNLDDLPLDADWDSVSPFEHSVASRKKAPESQPQVNDPAFSSNLVELPEVFELDEQEYSLDDFSVSSGNGSLSETLDEDFSDAFSDLIAVDLHKQTTPRLALQANLDQLAGDRQNLGKLNQALAYISQGDIESACNILNQVIDEGDDQQKQEARELLARIA